MKRAVFIIFLAFPAFAQRVTAIGMTVADADRSAAFFHDVLQFEKISDEERAAEDVIFGGRTRVVAMRLGDESIELTEWLTPKGKPIPDHARSTDLTFQHIAIVVSDMDRAYARLREHHVEHVSTAPQRIPDSNKAAAGVRAFYFRDPDRHNLELISFPADKGDPRWQKKDRLFLGIDHTAIGVSNTEASLLFYRNLLGLHVAGESWNSGTEQAHLNLVENASLHISGLRGSGGPGIEFLEYLSPPPRDRISGNPNDIVYWQTTLVVPQLKLQHPLVVRDPDGHAIRLVPQ